MEHLRNDYKSDTLGYNHVQPEKLRKNRTQRDVEHLLNEMAQDTANAGSSEKNHDAFYL